MSTVLVVDDDPMIRLLYGFELEDEGHDALSAWDCASALEILQSRRVDLVLLDIRLRGESGLGVLEAMRRRNLETPVILCTACPCPEEDLSGWGVDACIIKSSNLKELRSQIAKSLRRRHARSSVTHLAPDAPSPPPPSDLTNLTDAA